MKKIISLLLAVMILMSLCACEGNFGGMDLQKPVDIPADGKISAQTLSQLKNNNAIDYLEQHPIIDIKRTASELGISYNTTSTAVKKLQELGVLKETTNAARNRVFAYEEYLHILRQGT